MYQPELMTGATVGFVGATLGSVGATVGCVGATLGSVGATLGSVGATVGFVGATLGSVGATVGANSKCTRNQNQRRIKMNVVTIIDGEWTAGRRVQNRKSTFCLRSQNHSVWIWTEGRTLYSINT